MMIMIVYADAKCRELMICMAKVDGKLQNWEVKEGGKKSEGNSRLSRLRVKE